METKAENLYNRLIATNELLKSLRPRGSQEEFWVAVRKGTIVDDIQGLSHTTCQKNKVFLQECVVKNNDDISPKLEEWVERFEEAAQIYIQKIVEKDNLPHGSGNRFYGKAWYMYFFHYNAHGRVRLARVVLIISEQGRVEVENLQDHISENYIGTFQLVNNRTGIFELRGENQHRKKLYIQAIMGAVPTEIALGAYVTYEHNTVVSGTLVLELIQNTKNLDLTPRLLSWKENVEIFDNVNPTIRKFLSVKGMNYIKLPDDVFSLNILESRMDNYKPKKHVQFFDPDRPMIFISSPTNSISAEVHAKNSKNILVIKKQIEDAIPEVEVYYPGQDQWNTQEHTTYLDHLNMLPYVRFFVLIHPEPNAASASIIEMSWALIYCKTVMLFYKKGTIPKRTTDLSSSYLNVTVTREIEDLEAEHLDIANRIIFEVTQDLKRS